MRRTMDRASASGGPGAAQRAERGAEAIAPAAPAGWRLEGSADARASQEPALPPEAPRAAWGERLRVGVLGYPPDEVRRVSEQLVRLPEVEVRDPHAGRPQVIVCVAASAWRLVEFMDLLVVSLPIPLPRPKDRQTIIEYRVPVALLDLVGEIGPQVAALHALHGYLAPRLRPDQWLPCLRSASRRRPYAAGPAELTEEVAEAFLDAWADGPLTALDRQIMDCAARGLNQPERAKRLHMGESTLDDYERALKARLELDPHQHLAAVAVELGFYREWPPPEGPD